MPEFDPKLKIGDVLTNDDVSKTFAVAISSGIRPSTRNNLIVVICDHTKGPYDDQWRGDMLHYVGSGRHGDQSIDSGKNKTLANSKKDGKPVHLFEVFSTNEYVYQGLVELGSEPYTTRQKDDDRVMRNVWVFPLSLKQRIPTDKEIASNARRGQKHAESLTSKKLEDQIKDREPLKGSRRTTLSTTYARDPYVKEYSKRRARGKCQLCGNQAPFKDKDGKPYLECHHIAWLSKGGEDSIRNTVALCPNCHRKMHVLDNEEDKAILLEKAKENL